MGSNVDPNIGIIEANGLKMEDDEDDDLWGWWVRPWGYAYFVTGSCYHNSDYFKYGDQCFQGDTVEICLDLINYELSFARNGKNYGKAFDIKHDKTYKLAVSINSGSLSLVSFEVKE